VTNILPLFRGTLQQFIYICKNSGRVCLSKALAKSENAEGVVKFYEYIYIYIYIYIYTHIYVCVCRTSSSVIYDHKSQHGALTLELLNLNRGEYDAPVYVKSEHASLLTFQ
jgi:hypothetical protein